MEHIFFEAQLCSEILILKEKSNFGYTDHPGLGTSLHMDHTVHGMSAEKLVDIVLHNFM